MLAGMGICCGCLLWGLAASVGLGALLAASQVAYAVLRAVGAVYLIFLGAKLWLRKCRPAATTSDAVPQSVLAATGNTSPPWWFVRGLFTNLLNPKVGIFYITFLPQFIPSGVPLTSFSVLLACIHATEGILWFAILTLATRPLARWFKRSGVVQLLDRVTGTVLIGFGLALVFDRRR
jgi:threonine/homoserine/homoserine lactone efflux protein